MATSWREFERLLKTDPATLTDLERAARFLYLQKVAHGGKVRGQTFGVSNDRPGRFDVLAMGPALEAIFERLSGVTIESLDWQTIFDFADNADRFQHGVHFYKLEGDELRDLKNRPDFVGSVGRQARSLLLWTKRGVSRHAKILDTDVAWQIYEELEDTYFAVEEGRALRAMTPAEMFLQNAQAMVDIERKQLQHDHALADLGATVARVEENQGILKARPAGSESITHIRPRINKMFGLSAVTVDAVLRSVSYSPRVAAVVENHQVEDADVTYSVFWQKDVTKCFRQFAGECTQVTATMWTHPQIEGRFKMTLPKSEVH